MESVGSGNPAVLISFTGYLLVIVIVGFLSSKFSSSGVTEYFIGGRKMKNFVVALSAVASGRSSWLILGVSGMAFTRGISAVWAIAGYTIVEFFMFFFVGRRLRRYTERKDCLTIPDYFNSRFNDKKNTVRMIATLIIVIFLTSYISAQFNAGGKALSTTFDLSFSSALLITAVIVLFYTIVGGFLAVSIIDCIQAVIMIFALVGLPVIAMVNLGGWSDVSSLVFQHSEGFLDPLSLGAGALIGFLGIGLGSPGNPHILVRYMSIKNAEGLKKSALLGTFFNIFMGLGAIFIGITGKAFLMKTGLDLPQNDPENIFPLLAQNNIHSILFGFSIAAVFAAILSTADSQLLVVGSSITKDIYQKIFHKDSEVDHKKMMRVSRLSILTVVVLAIVLGIIAKDLIFWLVLFAWGGLGAAFGPPLILSLYWRKASKKGIIAGFIAGLVTVIIWYYVKALKSNLYELVPAFILSWVCTVVFSCIFPVSEENEREFQEVEG